MIKINNKGFAISIILYSIVFLIITILFIILGLEKNRYTVNQKLREGIINDLNANTDSSIIKKED